MYLLFFNNPELFQKIDNLGHCTNPTWLMNLSNYDLYIFDEPTSFLDGNTSSKILKNLKSFLLNKTAIIVSHDRKILKFCDKIYSLKKGKLFLNRKN